jgi:flagellar biosynthesis protein FlhG
LLARERLRVLPVAAGQRGVGKTMAVIGLARAAAALGARAVVLDQSPGDVACALALAWRWELEDLLRGERQWGEVALAGPDGVGIVPAARGFAALCEAHASAEQLFGGFARLSAPPSLVIVNLAPGFEAAQALLPGEAELMLVTRATPRAVTATYARIKEQVQRHGRRRFRLLVNRAGGREAASLHARMARAASRFLGAELAYAGCIPAGALPGSAAWTAIAQTLPQWTLAEYGGAPPEAARAPAARRREAGFH